MRKYSAFIISYLLWNFPPDRVSILILRTGYQSNKIRHHNFFHIRRPTLHVYNDKKYMTFTKYTKDREK